ncbi:MAG TPA: site-2 protease family protein [Ktedonobacteraceae bacterium]|nr:site-2 protease family protein [Ktedonobacteraceae bacterium]
MPGSIRLGKIAGIEIDINYSWIIILVLITWSLATQFMVIYPGWGTVTYWIVGLIAAILLFVSVLLHELAHSLVARSRGLPVKSITLFIFGGVSNIEREPQSPGTEFWMAIVGPITSIVIGIIAFLLYLPVGLTRSPVAAILNYLAIANILLGVFNLIPGFPLDGGRVLRSIVWKITGNLRRATRIAAGVGQFVAFLFILVGIWIFFGGNIIGGIWIGFIGWFLLNAARTADSQIMLESIFKGVTVREVMNPNPVTVPANISLQRLVDEYFLPQGLRSALVVQGDQLAGLITLSDIRHISRDQWAQTPVGMTMIPLERLHAISPTQNLNDVLPIMTSNDVNQLPVVQDGRVIGVLSRDAIMRFIEVRRGLGLHTTAPNGPQDQSQTAA